MDIRKNVCKGAKEQLKKKQCILFLSFDRLSKYLAGLLVYFLHVPFQMISCGLVVTKNTNGGNK